MKFYSLVVVTLPLFVTAHDVLPSMPDLEANSTSEGRSANMTLVVEGTKQAWAFPKYFECNIGYSVDYYDDMDDLSGQKETVFAYTLAVAGEEASLTVTSHDENWKNSVLYFNADATMCGPETSYQVSQFQVWDPRTKQGTSEKQCWMAPANHQISNIPSIHANVFKYMFVISKNDFEYVGATLFEDQTVNVWKQAVQTKDGPAECELLTSKETQSRIQLKIADVKFNTTVTFANFKEYSKPGDVSRVALRDEEKKECRMLTTANANKCEKDLNARDSTSAVDIARQQIEDRLNDRLTGYKDLSQSNAYPSTGIEYDMLGSRKTQLLINSLKSFVPEMVGRKMLHVRAQGCGDSYAFGTSHSITSAYAHANPGKNFSDVFSPQRLSNCALESGCMGGNPKLVIDMLVHHLNGKMPMEEEEPYIGFEGFCNEPKTKGIDTGIIGYMNINTTLQMKNALYFLGDVAVSVKANFNDSQYSKTSYTWPSHNITEHTKAHLGMGGSLFANETDHVVAVVGWGPCTVKPCNADNDTEFIETECWILQNSWGEGNGINNGYDIVHTDIECDYGVLSTGDAIIPIVDISTKSTKRPSKRPPTPKPMKKPIKPAIMPGLKFP